MRILFFTDHMVSSIWATLCFGQTYLHRSLQPECSHPVFERGIIFSALRYQSGHFFPPVFLTIDYANVQAAHAIVKDNLSLIIFPEGTRSQNGRLLPFKKVFSYFAHAWKCIISCYSQ